MDKYIEKIGKKNAQNKSQWAENVNFFGFSCKICCESTHIYEICVKFWQLFLRESLRKQQENICKIERFHFCQYNL